MKRLTAAVLAGLAWAAAAGAEQSSKIPDMVENRTFGFRVSNPERWMARRNQAGNLVVLNQPEKSKSDFVTISVEDLSKAPGISLDAYKKQVLQNLGKSIRNFEVRKDEPYTVSDAPAQQLIYAGELDGRSMRWKTVFTLKQNRAYVLTYASTDADYFKGLESADKILYSFRFL